MVLGTHQAPPQGVSGIQGDIQAETTGWQQHSTAHTGEDRGMKGKLWNILFMAPRFGHFVRNRSIICETYDVLTHLGRVLITGVYG